MSTRGNIAIENNDGKTFSVIYVHFDNYLEGTGVILHEHYKTRKKVEQLIELGDLSTLAPIIGEKQNFDNPILNAIDKTCVWCVAYGRDRGEEDVGAQTIPMTKLNEFIKGDMQEYLYIWRLDNKWYYTEYGDTNLRLLGPAVKKIIKENKKL